MRTSVWLAAVAAMSVSALRADSISPSSYATTLAVGESVTISKTVTVTQRATAPVDVFFLTDTTGSMSGALASVRTGFGDIVSSLTPLAANIAYGVGDYKDFGDPYAYDLKQNITTDTTAVQTALNGLSASGGGDTPEANLYALNQVATTTSWRAGSQRFVVWVGDQPGHDPSGGITEADATAALLAAGINVFAISVGGGGGNLDGTGQATRITDATGGQIVSGGYGQAADLIADALTTSILNYSTVTLGVTPPAGVGVSFTPGAGYTGTYDRSVNRTFDFNVTFTGVASGTYSFDIDALVDGAVVASEADRITVGAIPEPGTWALMLSGLGAVIAFKRRSMKG